MTKLLLPAGWKAAPTPLELIGGQGTVTKVQNLASLQFGALKQLHDRYTKFKPRRFRMRREAESLRAIDGEGTPKLLADNTADWERSDVPLYLLMEWIEGNSLAKYIGNKALDIDGSIAFIERCLTILEKCHQYEIYHRDLKPQNIILRNNKLSDPIIVDFGIAWTKSDSTHNTSADEELGNRFLRMPELAAGTEREERNDPRTDITFIAGIFFYLLTGLNPRQLEDENGKMPHEIAAHRLSSSLTGDPRWPRIKSIFDISFRHRIESRIQAISDFRYRLSVLNITKGKDSQLSQRLTELDAVRGSEEARQLERTREQLKEASRRYVNYVAEGLKQCSLIYGGSGPNEQMFANGGRSSCEFYALAQGTSSPSVRFTHHVAINGVNYHCYSWVEGEDVNKPDYYVGPVSDPDELDRQLKIEVDRQVSKILVQYTQKYRGFFR